MLEPPIVLVGDGQVELFASLPNIEKAIEACDAELYKGYDSKGRPVDVRGQYASGSLPVGISEPKVRDVLRALHQKGCVKIEERSRDGHLVAVLLPSEISGLPEPAEESPAVDVESLDFFTGRRYVAALLVREQGACVYCLKKLSPETAELDHLVPQVLGLANSYRNIVVACHGCNKAKGVLPGPDYVRRLYRDGVLNEAELKARLARIDAIQAGEIIPEISRAG